jgi:hypothetical protein
MGDSIPTRIVCHPARRKSSDNSAAMTKPQGLVTLEKVKVLRYGVEKN